MARLRVGIVGIGFMGSNHFNIWRARPDAEVVAIADVDERKLDGDWSGIAGNIDVGGGRVDLKGVKTYQYANQLIDDPAVDVVDICLPTHLHAPVAMKALAAGKHVLCEKPMASTVADAEKMARAARQAARKGRRFMVAHCIRFWPEYEIMKEMVASGRYGRVLSLSMRRLSATPVWSWQNWLMHNNQSGSAALDLHIHDTDFAIFLFGKPRAVVSRGVKGKASSGIDHIVTQYVYPKVPQVCAEGGWLMQPAAPFEMAFHAVLEKATVLYSSAAQPTLRIFAGDKQVETTVPAGTGYDREVAYFAECVAGGKNPETVTPEDALASVKTIFAEITSIRQGGKQVAVK